MREAIKTKYGRFKNIVKVSKICIKGNMINSYWYKELPWFNRKKTSQYKTGQGA